MSRALVIKGANFETNRVTQVTISGVPCTAIALGSNAYNISSMSVGTTITVTKTPADTTDEVTFSIANTSVAKVEDGKLYAVGFGSTTLTATCGSASATATVTVSSIELAPQKLSGAKFNTVSTWGTDNPIAYVTQSGNTAFATEKVTPLTTPDGVTGNAEVAVIKIPANTAKIKIESPTRPNWAAQVRFTTTNSTLNYNGQYFAKYISSSNVPVATTTTKYIEITDIPSSADSFAFHIQDDANYPDYTINVTFTPQAA